MTTAITTRATAITSTAMASATTGATQPALLSRNSATISNYYGHRCSGTDRHDHRRDRRRPARQRASRTAATARSARSSAAAPAPSPAARSTAATAAEPAKKPRPSRRGRAGASARRRRPRIQSGIAPLAQQVLLDPLEARIGLDVHLLAGDRGDLVQLVEQFALLAVRDPAFDEGQGDQPLALRHLLDAVNASLTGRRSRRPPGRGAASPHCRASVTRSPPS